MALVESNGHRSSRDSSIHGAETVIAPRPVFEAKEESSGDSMRQEARRGVALVEGSTPHLSAETRDLLRNRLRLAAILFFVGFLAFLIRWFFYWGEWWNHLSIFYTHAIINVVLGAFAVRLCRHCSYSLLKLRVSELVIFGCPAFFFVVNALDTSLYLIGLPGGH